MKIATASQLGALLSASSLATSQFGSPAAETLGNLTHNSKMR